MSFDLEEFRREVLAHVRAAIEADGDIRPVAFLALVSDEHGRPLPHFQIQAIVKADGFGDEADKDVFVALIRRAAAGSGAVAAAFASTAWAVRLPKAAAEDTRREACRHGSIEAHPERVEIALVVLEARLPAERECYMANILRSDNVARVAAWEGMDAGFAGRFAGLLGPPVAPQRTRPRKARLH